MNMQLQIEYKPNFNLQEILEQISEMEIEPLKIVDYYPTSFNLKPSNISPNEFSSFMDKLRNLQLNNTTATNA